MMKKSLSYFIVLIGFFLIWQLVVWLLALPAYILPSPLTVLIALYTHWLLINQNIWPTVIETLLALIFGSVAGMAVALTLSYFRWARFWFLPMLLTSQALPVFAIAPLLVIWFGYGIASKVLVAMLMIFFPVASAFYDGLCRTPDEWLDLGKVMGASRWRLLWRLRIPAAAPALASGLRVAATFAPMGAVIGEWVGSSSGLGFLMLNANARMQIDLMFAVLLILVLFTLLLYFSLDRILKKIIFWRAHD
jgi:putative hydroxymethylpyrimidine transport system permease protein